MGPFRPAITFRVDDKTAAMLVFLKQRWCASRSGAIRRCIELVYRGEEIENRVATFSARHGGNGKGKAK